MSNITKKALASSLKKILSKKEFNKITINDITEDCGVNRQTFYYHFKDIYDLLEWIYTNEVIGKIKNLETDNPTENWQQEFLYVFEYIIENKKFVYNIYYSVSRSFFLNFVYQQTNLVLTKAVNEKSKNMNIDEKNKKFIADFYKYAFVGLVQEWIENGMEENPEEIINKLSLMLDGNFDNAINKAMISCKNNGNVAEDHFSRINNTIEVGNGALREVEDYMLTRYACYLIAENGDPRKEQIAFAQSYFAVQTRKQELIEERISYIERTEARGKLRESEKRLSQNIYERGVDDAGFGRIRSKGDQALFGGFTTKQMKERLGVQDKRPLADFLPTLTIAAKNLATEMTNYNVEEKDLQGECAITVEHVENNTSVRDMLGQRGIKPEDLPASEDIKKLERRVKREEKKLAEQSGKLTNE